MKMVKVINELFHQGIIQSKHIDCDALQGGTASELYLLQDSTNAQCVVKFNEPEVLQAEAAFLDCYNHLSLIPTLLYADSSHRYIVYSFISGTTQLTGINKQILLRTFAEEVLNQYKNIADDNEIGFMDERMESWPSFLQKEILEASKIIGSCVEDAEHDFVLNILKTLEAHHTKREPFLLHGDCGIHNFIFNDSKLAGVIDPTPVIGYPLYDLIYAFCSSPDDLTRETFDAAVHCLIVENEKSNAFLYEEVVVGLYLRLGVCIKHHPYDFERYLEAWFYWKNVVCGA
ncbi:aminoglycoside phosphotransferase family protein [Marinococcus sp. PL1-022]|uniref:aminoglycoside phosphotransferase family protein n=1 Tax=Marinococcus sp. PL1-022 TaxID=3095363 RepID=UPI0029C1EBAF|nr:aminoglycoside phosphotransferase family protein [Marinococcus sp. PL1-022]MDX6153159.1 aminoglycoside phosphotransferase family protein [Marinococcus sp. PL1-022]